MASQFPLSDRRLIERLALSKAGLVAIPNDKKWCWTEMQVEMWLLELPLFASGHTHASVPLSLLDMSCDPPRLHTLGLGTPQCSTEELSKLLWQLYNGGMIQLEGQPEANRDWSLTSIQGCILGDDPSPKYTLSPRGFLSWERYAVPDWGRYFVSGVTFHDDFTVAVAATEAVAEDYLQWLFYDAGWTRDCNRQAHVIRTDQWQVYPWKCLPQRYEVFWPLLNDSRDDQSCSGILPIQSPTWCRRALSDGPASDP